jgi:peptidoglycan hydrolase-like protein with peptidoglycan-binding domain
MFYCYGGIFMKLKKIKQLSTLSILATMAISSTTAFATTTNASTSLDATPKTTISASRLSLQGLAAYDIIHTPKGDVVFLKIGCSGTWVEGLQTNLNDLSNQLGIGISLVVDSQYGSATAAAVSTFQRFVKNNYGCSSMAIDGQAGYQTWTAIYALQDGENPHRYIS